VIGCERAHFDIGILKNRHDIAKDRNSFRRAILKPAYTTGAPIILIERRTRKALVETLEKLLGEGEVIVGQASFFTENTQAGHNSSASNSTWMELQDRDLMN